MRAFISIIVITTILAPGLIKTGLWTWYETHKTKITQEFCINKDKPEMECNGKCHLEKELKEHSIGYEIKTKSSERPTPQFDFEDITLIQSSLSEDIEDIVCLAPFSYCYGYTMNVVDTNTPIDIPPPEIELAA